MTKGKARATGTAKPATSAETGEEKLIGGPAVDETRPAAPEIEQGAQKADSETTQNQQDGAAKAEEKKSDTTREKGPDNNKRLAYLETQSVALGEALRVIGCPMDGAEPIDVAICVLPKYSDLSAQIERLAAFIIEKVEGEPSQGQGAVDTAIRVIETQAARIDAWQGQRSQLKEALIAIGTPPGPDDSPVLMAADLIAMLANQKPDVAAGVDVATAVDEALAAAKAKDKAGVKADKARALADQEARAEADAVHAAALAGRVSSFSELPDDAPLALRFGFAGGIAPSIPAMPIDRERIDRRGARGMVNVAIDLPVEGPAVRVTDIWLIGGDKAVLCAIPGGIVAGGGHRAHFPAGYLSF